MLLVFDDALMIQNKSEKLELETALYLQLAQQGWLKSTFLSRNTVTNYCVDTIHSKCFCLSLHPTCYIFQTLFVAVYLL